MADADVALWVKIDEAPTVPDKVAIYARVSTPKQKDDLDRQVSRREQRKLIVINQKENQEDLMQEFVSVITSMAARVYGLRRSKRKTEEILHSISNETP